VKFHSTPSVLSLAALGQSTLWAASVDAWTQQQNWRTLLWVKDGPHGTTRYVKILVRLPRDFHTMYFNTSK
jgi:hypothetical protein